MTNMTITHQNPPAARVNLQSARPRHLRTLLAAGAIVAAGTGIGFSLLASGANQLDGPKSGSSTAPSGGPEQFSDVERGRRIPDATATAPEQFDDVERGLGPKSR
jgi:hypothetical protein